MTGSPAGGGGEGRICLPKCRTLFGSSGSPAPVSALGRGAGRGDPLVMAVWVSPSLGGVLQARQRLPARGSHAALPRRCVGRASGPVAHSDGVHEGAHGDGAHGGAHGGTPPPRPPPTPAAVSVSRLAGAHLPSRPSSLRSAMRHNGRSWRGRRPPAHRPVYLWLLPLAGRRELAAPARRPRPGGGPPSGGCTGRHVSSKDVVRNRRLPSRGCVTPLAAPRPRLYGTRDLGVAGGGGWWGVGGGWGEVKGAPLRLCTSWRAGSQSRWPSVWRAATSTSPRPVCLPLMVPRAQR